MGVEVGVGVEVGFGVEDEIRDGEGDSDQCEFQGGSRCAGRGRSFQFSAE